METEGGKAIGRISTYLRPNKTIIEGSNAEEFLTEEISYNEEPQVTILKILTSQSDNIKKPWFGRIIKPIYKFGL